MEIVKWSPGSYMQIKRKNPKQLHLNFIQGSKACQKCCLFGKLLKFAFKSFVAWMSFFPAGGLYAITNSNSSYLYVLPLTFTISWILLSVLVVSWNNAKYILCDAKTGIEIKTFLERVYWSILLSHLNTNRYYCMQRIFGPKHFKR